MITIETLEELARNGKGLRHRCRYGCRMKEVEAGFGSNFLLLPLTSILASKPKS
jgi:hypothetical protein